MEPRIQYAKTGDGVSITAIVGRTQRAKGPRSLETPPPAEKTGC